MGKTYYLNQDNMNAMIADLERLKAENSRLREALEFYAKGDNAKTFSGEERYLQFVAHEMDISKVNGEWKTGKCAREALKGKE
jgi:hypothetical protein